MVLVDLEAIAGSHGRLHKDRLHENLGCMYGIDRVVYRIPDNGENQ